MFFKKKTQERQVRVPANLNAKQQREIKAVVEKAKKDNGISDALYEAIIKKFEVTNGAFDDMIFDLSKIF